MERKERVKERRGRERREEEEGSVENVISGSQGGGSATPRGLGKKRYGECAGMCVHNVVSLCFFVFSCGIGGRDSEKTYQQIIKK